MIVFKQTFSDNYYSVIYNLFINLFIINLISHWDKDSVEFFSTKMIIDVFFAGKGGKNQNHHHKCRVCQKYLIFAILRYCSDFTLGKIMEYFIWVKRKFLNTGTFLTDSNDPRSSLANNLLDFGY